ncbi:MAG: D-alanyl-D-alanine carboxypeptidase family protein [Chloroflexota bacterium]
MAASALALVLFLTAVFPMLSTILQSDVAANPVNVPTSRPPLSMLAMRLQIERTAIVRDTAGQVVTVFGLPVADVRLLLLPVNRHRGLPTDYEPPDLARYGGRLVRASVLPDLTAMVDGAAADGVELAAISGYRSPDEQALAFQSAVWRAMARETGEDGRPIDRAEAEVRSTRFVAPPGHSQHQLGTAIDFSSWEINYALQPRFAETEAGRWLELHAWEYGFVLPYARNGEERSGYAYEPWHYRWVGRDLAAVLQHDNYLNHPTLIVDDYLQATEELLAFEGVP